MKRIIAAFIALSLLVAPALASNTFRITFSPGGGIIDFVRQYQDLREHETKVVVDGACISACTIMLGILRDEQVCVTERASLGFHSATQGDEYSADGTQILWHIYPPKVRAMLTALGWDGTVEHENLIYIEGDMLRTIYHECTPAEAA